MAETAARVPGVALPDGATRDALRALLMAVADTGGGPDVPVISPAMLLGDPEIAAHCGLMRPPEGMGVVHEAQVFRAEEACLPDLLPEVLIGVSERPNAVVFDFEILDGDKSLGAMQTRLRFVTREEMAALKGTAFSDRLDSPGAVWTESAVLSAKSVEAYLRLAHDDNPIHSDDAAARAVGLPGAVVPGMLLCGAAEYAFAAACPGAGIAELKCRFLAAVPVGETVRFGVIPRKRDAVGQVSVARVFVVEARDRIAMIADITALAP